MIRRFALLMTCFLMLPGCFAFPTQVLGQKFDDKDKVLLRKIRDKVLKEIEAEKQIHESQLELLIDEMVAECKLDESQKLKLQVAAKGAIQKSMKEFTKSVGEAFQMFQLPDVLKDGGSFLDEDEATDNDKTKGADKDSDKDLVKDEDSDEENAEDENDGVFNNAMIQQQGGWILQTDFLPWCRQSGAVQFTSWKPPRKHAIWRKAIRSTLTPQQQESISRVLDRREKALRESTVASFIANVDNELVLTADQRTQLTEYVDSKFGSALVVMAWKESNMNFGVIAPDPSPALKKILSETQLKLWNQQFGQQLETIKRRAAQFEALEVEKNEEGPANGLQKLLEGIFSG